MPGEVSLCRLSFKSFKHPEAKSAEKTMAQSLFCGMRFESVQGGKFCAELRGYYRETGRPCRNKRRKKKADQQDKTSHIKKER